MKLSILIPAHNEEELIRETVDSIEQKMAVTQITYEILVVNDHSKDQTESILKELQAMYANFRYMNNTYPNGFGNAVRFGLEHFDGDCVALMMADLSDSPDDLIRFYTTLNEKKVDCVFGNRWGKEGTIVDYPIIKRIINRVANWIIRVVMNISYSDTTNAFKLYRREVIDGLYPILSPQFNLTIELPLKAIIRGYTYAVVPNSWRNRKFGVSKLKINEMGSRYFFILIYCFIEKHFSKGDYKK